MGRRTRFLVLSMAVLAVLVAGLAVFRYIPDDTYITLRYARNVLDGKGFVFNSGERVEGYTNFLWLLILVAAGKLGLPLVPLARSLSLAFSLGTLVLVAVAARRAAGPARGDTSDASPASGGWNEGVRIFLAPMLCAASPPFLVWSLSGTEMPLFTFLLLGGFLLIRSARWNGALAVFALLGLARPEGTLYFAIAALWLFARAPRKLEAAAAAAGIAAVFYAPYLVWKWRYFHAIVPNTFYAKTGPFGIMLDNGARYAGGFLISYGYLMAAGAALLGAPGKSRDRWLLPSIFASTCVLEVFLLGGDWMPHYRLLLPALPFVALVAADGVLEAAERARRSAVFGLVLVLLAMLPGAVGYERFTMERITVKAFARLGERLAEILPLQTTIGCGSTGAIGYYTGMPIVDILGLTEPTIARHGAVVSPQPGHFKTDGAYVFSRRPDLLLLGNIQIHRGERGRASMPLKAQEIPIVEQRGFDDLYEYVNIPLGSGFFLSCFKLKGYFLPLAPSAAPPNPSVSGR